MSRRAIVTGGSRGIGRAIAHRLAADGFEIDFTYRSHRDAAEAVVDELRAAGATARCHVLDLADRGSIEAFARQFQGDAAADVLVNNAGEIRDALLIFQSDENLRHVLDVNLLGVIRLTKGILKGMLRRRAGRIVNIASDSGLIGNAGQTNYSAAKAGVVAFTKSLAREVASFGITVNAIAPGFVETEILRDLPAAKRSEAETAIPLGRFGRPEEIAGPVAFLASDRASYLTGVLLRVDGGLVG